jgi:hypothetical protein
LVVKVPIGLRAKLIAEDPDVYYVTDHYEKYPSVLVRLARIHRKSLARLLRVGWEFASAGGRRRGARQRGAGKRS